MLHEEEQAARFMNGPAFGVYDTLELTIAHCGNTPVSSMSTRSFLGAARGVRRVQLIGFVKSAELDYSIFTSSKSR